MSRAAPVLVQLAPLLAPWLAPTSGLSGARLLDLKYSETNFRGALQDQTSTETLAHPRASQSILKPRLLSTAPAICYVGVRSWQHRRGRVHGRRGGPGDQEASRGCGQFSAHFVENTHAYQLQVASEDEFEKWEPLVSRASDLEGGVTRNSSPSAIELVRNVYNCFLAKFPLFFGYWKKYADLEFSIGGTEIAEEVRSPLHLLTRACTDRVCRYTSVA
jgi:hypothetical protein